MGALRRDGAQAGGCSSLVPPEEGGGREQKADALSVLSVQHGARGTHWGSGHGHCLHGGAGSPVTEGPGTQSLGRLCGSLGVSALLSPPWVPPGGPPAPQDRGSL